MARRSAARLGAAAHLAAWRGVRLLPAGLAHGCFALAADAAWLRRGRGVRRLEANLARARPEADQVQLRALSRAGMRSYLRYWCDAFRLPSWSPAQVSATVRAEGAEPLQRAVAEGRGAVAFLGHLGNWDHLGAWGAQHVAPVTTVAERLEPAQLFDAFVDFRRRLGITVLPLTGGGTFGALLRAVRSGGVVALLADRDLTGTGVPVRLLGEPARAAGGPAALALATGAPLHPVTCSYERLPRGAPARWGLHLVVHPAVPVPERTAEGGRATQVAAMTQACVDVLSEAIREHPQDWHVLQRVFDADRRAAS
ncbi:phosphatidylinositol mannoside acyltransferase [Quadrisphaera sp. DSM 44207]|uniref:phosphatidylinositol mannoside acyltransferase n=1 Tax=Quadrisphaera sp. DSM 44207 TaxID=1881057 RepID=UPI000B84A99C|nr:phosphatidylinositol mannoside acyltransferase [Quadrisphaera sp. DSM 44207]